MYNPANNKPKLFEEQGRPLHWYRADKSKCEIMDSFLSHFTDDRVFMGENDNGVTRLGGTIEFHPTFEEAKQALIDSCYRDIDKAQILIDVRKARLKKLADLRRK